jgi:hypothetical protein
MFDDFNEWLRNRQRLLAPTAAHNKRLQRTRLSAAFDEQ